MSNSDQKTIETVIGKEVIFSKTFHGNGEDFSAVNEATKWLRERNFAVGSMQREAPMGIAYDPCRELDIAKWRNLGGAVKHLDGALCGESKRSGPVTIYLLILIRFFKNF